MPRHAHPWYRPARGAWFATVRGKQINLGVTNPADEAGALAAFQQLLDQLPAASPCPRGGEGSPRTVTQAVAAFLSRAEARRAAGKLDPRSLANYRLALDHWTKAFGPRPLPSLAADEIEKWADRPGWSPSYQHNVLGTVGQVLKAEGVALKIARPPKESRGADAVLSDELFALVVAAPRRGRYAGDWLALMRLLRETGARPQEAARLEVDAVDWANACARLRRHKTARKTGKARPLHFCPAAMAILEAQRALYREGLLFRTRWGRAYSPNTIVKQCAGLSKRLGFHFTAYGLGRHSYATKALSEGIPDTVVAALLGHRDTKMIHAHYSHVNENARVLKAAAERISLGRQAG